MDVRHLLLAAVLAPSLTFAAPWDGVPRNTPITAGQMRDYQYDLEQEEAANRTQEYINQLNRAGRERLERENARAAREQEQQYSEFMDSLDDDYDDY